MLKPHLSYIAAISVHRRTSGYPWRGGSVRSDFQCRLLYLKTYGGSREVVEDGRSLLNSWRWSLGWYKWGVKCTDPNSRTSVFWTTLLYNSSIFRSIQENPSSNNSQKVTLVTLGHLMITVGNHSNSMRQLRATVGHLRHRKSPQGCYRSSFSAIKWVKLHKPS